MKILIAGDPHGSRKNMLHLVKKAAGNKCKKVLLLGDVGYLPNYLDGREYVDYVSKIAVEYGIEVHWIKGNHDNHEILSEYRGTVEIAENFIFHQNIDVWTWGKYTFCAVGGAVSVDVFSNSRNRGIDWWPNEVISVSDIYAAMEVKEKIDIVIAHDCPISVNIDKYLEFKTGEDTIANRTVLQEIVDILKPSKLFHGHYHERINETGTCLTGEVFESIGLGDNRNSRKNQSIIFDCEV